MKKYKLTKDGVQNTKTGAFIPDDPKNRDWRKYQKWLAKGNTPDPEFTAEEKVAKKQRKKRQIEIVIIDMRLRKDAADAEGLTELAIETQTELDELRAELAKKH